MKRYEVCYKAISGHKTLVDTVVVNANSKRWAEAIVNCNVTRNGFMCEIIYSNEFMN